MLLTLPLEHLATMAEGISDPAVVERLEIANRSRLLVMLRAVLDRSRALVTTSPLPPLDEAWSLLADAQRRDEAAVETVITHPRTGMWAAKVLPPVDRDDSTPPLWADLGYLHQMAAAAAIRARLDFTARVPVWRGQVMLPTLGLATVPSDDEWSVAEVRSDGRHVVIGGIRLTDDLSVDGPDWLALRSLRVGGFDLWLDDIDPYREFGGLLPPRRLPASEVARWCESLRHTWQLLTDHHPETAAELAAGLRTLVPVATAEQGRPYSASHNDAFGSVALSLPPDPTTFAATLVHEFQHNKFGVLLSLVDMFDPEGDNETPRLYAPWRDDPRPPIGLMHGAFSFLGVTAFYYRQSIVDNQSSTEASLFEFEYHREQTTRAVHTLLADTQLSELGRDFLHAMRDRLQKWATEPIPDDVRTAAQQANDEHHLSWRIRHLHPSDSDVSERAEAWLHEHAKPVGLPLVAGDAEATVGLCRQQVLVHPESVEAWVGLALASGDKTLLTHPELVFSVHQGIRARGGTADPLRLAEWLR